MIHLSVQQQCSVIQYNQVIIFPEGSKTQQNTTCHRLSRMLPLSGQ